MQPVLNPRLPDERLSVCIMGEARSFEENEVPSHGRISTRFAYDLRHSVPSGMGDEVSVSCTDRDHVLTGEVARRVRELVRQKCKALDVRVVKGHVSKDHVHILVSCPTTISPAKLTGAGQGSIFPQGAGGVCPLEEAILGTAFLGTGVFLCDGRSCDG